MFHGHVKTQTADCADCRPCRLCRPRRLCRLVAFLKVNFDLLYFLGLFTFCRVKMPNWPAAWHWVLKKINAPQ